MGINRQTKIGNDLADAFYDEDYEFIKKVTGKMPHNQEEAEQIIEKYQKVM